MERGLVPIVDLQESPFPYTKLREACSEWGCFRVSNHRVPTSLMSEMKTVTSFAFDLPADFKGRSTSSGYLTAVHLGNSIYESLAISPTNIPTFCSHLDLSSDQRETIEKYTHATRELIDDVSKKMGTCLGVDSSKYLFNNWDWHVRMVNYRFTPETIGSEGLWAHTDPGFLTLVHDDEVVGGLEVEVADTSSGSSYVSIEPSPGSFFVILGDVAVPWSNGGFRNVKHRVECKKGLNRVSIVSFFEAPLDAAVEAPEEVLMGSERLYRPFYFGEYKKLRSTKVTDCGQPLSLFRVQ